MKINLREYQQECIDIIYENFKTSKKQYIQLPTGAGKTFVFLHYLRDYSYKSLIVVPNKELEEQVLKWAKVIIKDRKTISFRENPRDADIIIITSQTLVYKRNIEFFREFYFDTLIIDEAHHAQAKTYKNFLQHMKEKTFNLLGCTATPERLDGKCLNEIFNKMTYQKSIVELIESGDLCDIEAVKIKTGVKISSKVKNGDFEQKVLKSLDNPSRNIILHKCYFDYCQGKKTLIFCVGVDHAKSLAKHLKELGVKAESIYGDLSYVEREAILRRFKSGETMVLTNCQILTEGFDEPSIECLLIARPTMSKALYCQMVGRGLRNHPGKEVCQLFELADNSHNICTFNVLGNLRQDIDRDYEPGTRLSRLVKDLEALDIEELDNLILEKEKHNLFTEEDLSEIENSTDMYHKVCGDMRKCTDRQYELLKNYDYFKKCGCWDIPSFMEASFILWKEKLRERYG